MIIKDCIYRFIEVPEICRKFIDTLEFQRLRHIKQLGFVYLVYPSGNHSRFEHSLGVMHLAGKVVDVLRKNGVYITERQKVMVQVAGLLHDVGHVAFSHLLDYILKEGGIKDHHEDRSIQLLRRLNDKTMIFEEDEIISIGNMIKGEPPKGSLKPFLYEIVCNQKCGLDVDRFDYLQRDAYYTGIPGFQPDYLIECIRVNDNGHLSFLTKASSDIRLLFETRTRMFTLVYRHKTVMKIEKIVRDMIRDLGLVEQWDTVNWLDLDDSNLLQSLKMLPEYKSLYIRSWNDEVSNDEKYKHCTTITKEEIEKQIALVPMV